MQVKILEMIVEKYETINLRKNLHNMLVYINLWIFSYLLIWKIKLLKPNFNHFVKK